MNLLRSIVSDVCECIRAVPDHPLFVWVVFVAMVVAAFAPR